MGELLNVVNLVVGYGGSEPVVRGVSFSVSHGEKVAVVGESGSGKSTMAAAILGLLPGGGALRSGFVTFNGERLDTLKKWAFQKYRGARIGYVPQDPATSLNPVVKVGKQVGEVLLLHGRATRRDVLVKVVDILEKAGLDNPQLRAQQYPQDLSGGQRQRVLIGIALACSPQLVIADEPTSALDVTVQRKILNHIDQRVAVDRTAVLFITHDLGVAADRADRIIVMQHGRIVEQGPTEQVINSPSHPYTRALLDAVPSMTQPTRSPRPIARNLVTVESLTKRFQVSRSESFTAVEGVSFTIGEGQTVGLVGESGSGKTTTARIVTDLETATSGTVKVKGKETTGLKGKELREFRRSVQLVPQNPYASLNPKLTIAAIIREPLDAFAVGTKEERRKIVLQWLKDVGLDEAYANRKPAELSGGQRQRVAIARALTLKPELLVLDEPVSALDVSVQAQILQLLDDLQKKLGISYLFVSHDLAVIRQISDSVVVMRYGKVVETGAVQEIFVSPRHDYTAELIAAIPGNSHRTEVGVQR